MSVLEMYFGKIKWPVVVLVSVIALAIAAYYINSQNNTTHLREQIVQTCGSSSNPVACAKNLTSAVNAVNQ